jgi:hypothetical protein
MSVSDGVMLARGREKILRLVVAFILAPILPTLLLRLVAWLIDRQSSDGPSVLPAAALLGYPIALSLSVLLYWHAHRRGRNSLIDYVGTSAVAGAAVGLLGLAIPFFLLFFALLAMSCGAVTAIAFWLIARPDKLSPKR